MGFSRQEYCSGLPFPSPGNLPNPGTEPLFLALQLDSLPLSHQGSPGMINKWSISISKHAHQHHEPFSSVQSLSCVQLFATPWTAALQASLSITNSRELAQTHVHKLVMPPNYLILCYLLLLLPSVFSSIRVFSNESVLRIR